MEVLERKGDSAPFVQLGGTDQMILQRLILLVEHVGDTTRDSRFPRRIETPELLRQSSVRCTALD
jgi:hypothetical protein